MRNQTFGHAGQCRHCIDSEQCSIANTQQPSARSEPELFLLNRGERQDLFPHIVLSQDLKLGSRSQHVSYPRVIAHIDPAIGGDRRRVEPPVQSFAITEFARRTIVAGENSSLVMEVEVSSVEQG